MTEPEGELSLGGQRFGETRDGFFLHEITAQQSVLSHVGTKRFEIDGLSGHTQSQSADGDQRSNVNHDESLQFVESAKTDRN